MDSKSNKGDNFTLKNYPRSLGEKSKVEGLSRSECSGVEGHDLITRELPLESIKMLKNDILVLYLFDYTAYPPLKSNVAVEFEYNFTSQDSFYSFHENRKQPYLSYLVINGSKIEGSKPTTFSYNITGIFKKDTQTKTSTKEYHTSIQVIDKYSRSRANFEYFEEGFTLKMRSNDTDFAFPMSFDDIFGNNLNIIIKQVNSSLPGGEGKVKINIKPQYSTILAKFYRKAQNSRAIKNFGFNLISDAVLAQRIDKPNQYQIQFLNFSSRGVINEIEALTFNDVELTSTMKINPYTHMATLNADNDKSYLLWFLLKMNPSDPLPLSRVFYPDYKLVYYDFGGPMFDASHTRKENKVIWIYKLGKLPLEENINFLEQRIEIFAIFLPDQSMKNIGNFSLAGLKDKVDARCKASRQYQNLTCEKINTFSIQRGILECRLFNKTSNNNPSEIEIQIIIDMKPVVGGGAQEKSFAYSVEDVIYELEAKEKSQKEICLMNYWHGSNSRMDHKYFIKPYVMVYHVPGNGFFMRSSTQEWLELLKESEVSSDMKLTNTLCQPESKTLILRYQKDLKDHKGFNNTDGGFERWSRILIIVINLDSKFRADNRIITKAEYEVPFSVDTPQMFFSFYLEKNHTLFIRDIAELPKDYLRFAFNLIIDMHYPKITLSTNSTKNFTADMKIYLDSKSATTEGAYGFPFKIQAKAVEKFKIEKTEEIPMLKNGNHSLEKYLRVTGPMNSMQQVLMEGDRLGFIPRLLPTSSEPADLDFIDTLWVEKKYFFGVTKNSFYLYDYFLKSSCQKSYAQEVRSVTHSCCSTKRYFYALHYNTKLPKDPVNIRIMEVIRTNKTILKSYDLIYIDSDFVQSIPIASSQMSLESVADRVVALCIQNKNIIKLILLDHTDINHPKVTPLREINAKSLGRRAVFHQVAIISLMKKNKWLGALNLAIAARSHIFLIYAHYDSRISDSKQNSSIVTSPDVPEVLGMNGYLQYIKCSKEMWKEENKNKEINTESIVSSQCLVVLNNYLVKTLIISTQISSSSDDNGLTLYSLKNGKLEFGDEYEIPRFYNVISIKSSLKYLAVHAVNKVDFHQEIMVYKRGRRHVWGSAYIYYEAVSSYAIGRWIDGSFWVFVKQAGKSRDCYMIGNMTMEVKSGYNSSENLTLLYSTFERPRQVSRYIQEFGFSENLERNEYLLLVICGAILGVYVALMFSWLCWSIYRWIYVSYFKTLGKKKKRMVPILIKKRKEKDSKGLE